MADYPDDFEEYEDLSSLYDDLEVPGVSGGLGGSGASPGTSLGFGSLRVAPVPSGGVLGGASGTGSGSGSGGARVVVSRSGDGDGVADPVVDGASEGASEANNKGPVEPTIEATNSAPPQQGTAIVLDDDDFIKPAHNEMSADIDFSAATEAPVENVLSDEDRARIHADKLMSALFKEGDESKELRKFLYSNAAPDLFSDENYFLYNLAYKHRNDNFALDEEFIQTYYDVHIAEIERARANIDIEAYGSIDGSPARGYAAGLLAHFRRLQAERVPSEEEYKRSFENYILYYEKIRASRVLAEAQTILEDGMKSRDKRGMVSGFEDAHSHVIREFANIDSATQRNQGSGFISLRDAILEPKEQNAAYKICDFGEIEQLNKHFGGVMSSQLMMVAAPPKSGKTKFCMRLIHNAAIEYHRNVTIWPVEGGIAMCEAQLRAIHFDYLYNTSVDNPADFKFGVDQKCILMDQFEEKGIADFKPLEQASAYDLVSGSDYGHVDMIDRPFTVETFIDEIDTSRRSNNSSLIVMDYMQLMTSRTNLSKRETLERAMPEALNYAKQNNITIISPAQYRQEAVRELGKSQNNDNAEMRTAIGDSAEIMRSADLVFAMYAGTEDLKNKRVKFMSIPSRMAEPFESFEVYADMATCRFRTLPEDM